MFEVEAEMIKKCLDNRVTDSLWVLSVDHPDHVMRPVGRKRFSAVGVLCQEPDWVLAIKERAESFRPMLEQLSTAVHLVQGEPSTSLARRVNQDGGDQISGDSLC